MASSSTMGLSALLCERKTWYLNPGIETSSGRKRQWRRVQVTTFASLKVGVDDTSEHRRFEDTMIGDWFLDCAHWWNLLLSRAGAIGQSA